VARSLAGTRIRERRKSLKITQAALAKQVAISPSYLNLIEHNRRGIAGRTLLALADALKIEARTLSDGADSALIETLTQAASSAAFASADLHRIEEFVGRFPALAELMQTLVQRNRKLDIDILALTDRLANDPYFAEAIHLMLSNITAIRSTAEILRDGGQMTADQYKRFTDNLVTESERMSTTAIDVLDYFEPASGLDPKQVEHDPFDRLLRSRGNFLEEMERPDADPVRFAEEFARDNDLHGLDTSRLEIGLQHYRNMSVRVPLATFESLGAKLAFDPLQIAMDQGLDVGDVLWRLAHMPENDDQPKFGLLEIDGSGAVVFVKELASFSLPHVGRACPMWPIYRALSAPNQPIQSFIELPSGDRFLTVSVARYVQPSMAGLPGLTRARMLITPHYRQILSSAQISTTPKLAAGTSCPMCPRNNCVARRSDYLLA
jgi:transcriptional regulator with XRE-family HTH domain